mgnify:CR=1 FL=1
MSLQDVNLSASINTSETNFSEEFFIPLLSESTGYDRAVGFFTSGWIRVNARGVAGLLKNRGTARWVASPILDEDDWRAMEAGARSKSEKAEIVASIVDKRIDQIVRELEEDTLDAFASMIAEGLLDFRLAVPTTRLTGGDFHTKLGIFRDAEGNRVGFAGSYNDSAKGLRNYESLHVYWSWSESLLPHLNAVEQEFNRIWNGLDPSLELFALPDASKSRILRLRPPRTHTPKAHVDSTEFQTTNEASVVATPNSPSPEVQLRPYQREAVEAWKANEHRGLLEMATGTGKTITALTAVSERIAEGNPRIILVAAPFSHLVDQWAEEARKFGFSAISVGSSHSNWEARLASSLRRFRSGAATSIFIATTIGSMLLRRFTELIQRDAKHVLFIADEAHNFGAKNATRWLRGVGKEFPERLALSATPTREYDQEGTAFLDQYFGGTVFTYGLEEAIGTFLVPYEYHPHAVEMTEAEFDQYAELSKQIARLSARRDEGDRTATDRMKRLLIKRARVLNNSVEKLSWLREFFSYNQQVEHTLVYVGDKLFAPTMEMLGYELQHRVHEFTGQQSLKERRRLLHSFERGDLEVLAAMKCLDEGIDVPPTRTAIFVASSGNSREFIQRRGRVLRKSPGKEFAVIHDLISTPPAHLLTLAPGHEDSAAVRSALCREWRRARDFASLSMYEYTALDTIKQAIGNHYDLEECD